jgi:hypothetical protein
MGWLRRSADEAIAAVGAALLAGIVPLVQHGGEVERGIDALTAEAQRQISLQYDTGSAQDVKTIGMVAAAAAALALVFPALHQPSGLWAIPLLLLAASTYCLVRSLLHRDFERGPQVPDLYRTYSGTVIEAKQAILQELVRSIDHNTPLLHYKARWFMRGLVCLALAIISTAAVLAVLTLGPV